jgi:hypothetical protein
MKRLILSVVSCLLLGAATTLANNVLVIHMQNGTVHRYELITVQPEISFSGDNVVVRVSDTATNTYTQATYAMKEVSFFNYERNNATAISGVDANNMKVDGDQISFSGLPAGSKVFVYTSGGQTCLTVTADDQGNASVSLSNLARGVYIINANNISTKITKK